jgi:hypothetical protein
MNLFVPYENETFVNSRVVIGTISGIAVIPRCNQIEYKAARRAATEAYYQYVEEPPTKPTT